MDMKLWLEGVRGASVKKAMPVLSFPSIQLLGIGVDALIGSAENQAAGMKAVADRTQALAAVSMMDLSVEAEMFGAEVRFSRDEIPTVVGKLIETQAQAEALEIPALDQGRGGLYIKAIGQACKLITDRPVLAGVIAPFSLAGRLMDVSQIMIACYEHPQMVGALMTKATEFLLKYISAYKKAGANGIVIADPLSGILSPGLIEEFSIPYLKQLFKEVQSDDFLVIYHNCGNAVLHLLDSILELKADAYHFGNAIDLQAVLQRVPAHAIIMGNIDPAAQFRNGTPASIKEATLGLLQRCGGYSNFVISSGCDIPPLSPWENIDAFFEAVADFYSSN